MQSDTQQPATDPQNHITSIFGHSTPPLNCDPRLLKIYPVEPGAGLVPIVGDSAEIGRDTTCEFVVNDSSVSRRHAKITKKGTDFFVEDLDSTNGTWVNESKISNLKLCSGDRIRVGTSIFKFLNADNVEAKYHESIYDMMTHDALTGAWNKRYLMDVLDREISLRKRNEKPMSLLMMDLDFFKSINDQHGHIIGDEVLVEFGKRMLRNVRDSDLFARFGGEEFAVLLSDAPLEVAVEVAERYRQTIINPAFETSIGSISCTFSGGISTWTFEDCLSRTEFLAIADKNLYLAKNQGRNQVAY